MRATTVRFSFVALSLSGWACAISHVVPGGDAGPEADAGPGDLDAGETAEDAAVLPDVTPDAPLPTIGCFEGDVTLATDVAAAGARAHAAAYGILDAFVVLLDGSFFHSTGSLESPTPNLLSHELGHALDLGHVGAEHCLTLDDTAGSTGLLMNASGGNRDPGITPSQCLRARCVAANWLLFWGRISSAEVEAVCAGG